MTSSYKMPFVSVIIPAFERVEPLKYTLRSAAASIGKSGYAGEIIVVDDGIATGATLFATVKLCQKQHPKKLIVAVPISGKEAAGLVNSMVDEALILETPEDFYAVSQGYESFSNLSDEETLAFIEKASESTRMIEQKV
jgi:predicted phosphoribosyltransferase